MLQRGIIGVAGFAKNPRIFFGKPPNTKSKLHAVKKSAEMVWHFRQD